MKILTLILTVLITASIYATERLQPAIMYKVITDTVNKEVPLGKCLITGVVAHLGEKVANANVFSAKSNNVQTDNSGRFRILVDTADTYLIIHKLNLPETYVEYYKFNNQHHIDIEVYIPEENMMIIVDKPVIYLYGEANQEININVVPKGDFTFTYPLINNQNTWKGSLTNEGILIDKKVYPYIFYETKMSDLSFNQKQNLIQGSVVSSIEVTKFLEQSLTSLNLNSQEKTDFITYWAPRMTQHDRLFVQFWTEHDYDKIATLKTNPSPDNLLRVFMVYAPLENGINIESIPQKFEPIDRVGFTIIEWGGSELPKQKLYSLKTL